MELTLKDLNIATSAVLGHIKQWVKENVKPNRFIPFNPLEPLPIFISSCLSFKFEGEQIMKSSTYLKNTYKTQKELILATLKVIDYYLCVEDIKHVETIKK